VTVSERAVYDVMVFFQSATLPADKPQRIHGTLRALIGYDIRLCMCKTLLEEIRKVLSDEELRRDYPSLTAERVAVILDRVLEYADWFENVPRIFSVASHTKDDHLFNLAIESKARYLVTFEKRILALQDGRSADARRLRELAPSLRILNPPALAQECKTRRFGGKPPLESGEE
jgi:putative PIN family toxin of toxin-antitoxin system